MRVLLYRPKDRFAAGPANARSALLIFISMQRRASARPNQRKDRCEQHREQGDERRRRVDIYPI